MVQPARTESNDLQDLRWFAKTTFEQRTKVCVCFISRDGNNVTEPVIGDRGSDYMQQNLQSVAASQLQRSTCSLGQRDNFTHLMLYFLHISVIVGQMSQLRVLYSPCEVDFHHILRKMKHHTVSSLYGGNVIFLCNVPGLS